MSRPAGPVAVVIALADPSPVDGAGLARFLEEAGPLGEVVLVDASGRDLPGLDPRVRVIRRPPGRLAPELWRDGLLATSAPLVAFSTARMIPHRGWLASLVTRLQETNAAGVGGPIEPGADLSATDRAVAMLRYSGYFPPLPPHSAVEPPGDNALYRRDRLMEVGPSWADGFWEVEVHRALRVRGEILAMAEAAVVTFEGGVAFPSMIRQRWAHARRYGAGRASGLGAMARLARAAACPMVPPLLIGRTLAALKARGMPAKPWLAAMPALAVLAMAWALGEAVGTLRNPGRFPLDGRREPRDGPRSPALPHQGVGRKTNVSGSLASRNVNLDPLPPSPLVGEGRGEGAVDARIRADHSPPEIVDEIHERERRDEPTRRAG